MMNDADVGMHTKATPTSQDKTPEESSRHRLLELLARAELSVFDLALEGELSLEELTSWFGRFENLCALEHIVRITELRGQMLLAQYRSNAVLRLVEMTGNDQPVETARKACVDLLRADLNSFTRLSTNDNEIQPDDVYRLNETELLSEMERMSCEI